MSGKVWAVLTAAGSGSRLGADVPKALVSVGGQTLLELALARLLALPGIAGVVVTCPEGYLEDFSRAGDTAEAGSTQVSYVLGGPSRQASVKAGLDAIFPSVVRGSETGGDQDVVLVHDAARALAPTTLMGDLVDAVTQGANAVIPGLEVADTIKQVALDDSGNEIVVGTPTRSSLRIAQTPQAFSWPLLWDAHVRAEARGADEKGAATDDAALVEEFGTVVTVIPGSEDAFKVTVPADLARAEALLRGGGSGTSEVCVDARFAAQVC